MIRLRPATPADAGALALLEAECEPPVLRVGAAGLAQRCEGVSPRIILAHASEAVVGALLSVRLGRLGELAGSNAARVHALHRDGGGLLVVCSVWLAGAAHAPHDEIEAALLAALPNQDSGML